MSLKCKEYTTLLLNCYTKLKDVSKLDEFIMVRIYNLTAELLYQVKRCVQIR